MTTTKLSTTVDEAQLDPERVQRFIDDPTPCIDRLLGRKALRLDEPERRPTSITVVAEVRFHPPVAGQGHGHHSVTLPDGSCYRARDREDAIATARRRNPTLLLQPKQVNA